MHAPPAVLMIALKYANFSFEIFAFYYRVFRSFLDLLIQFECVYLSSLNTFQQNDSTEYKNILGPVDLQGITYVLTTEKNRKVQFLQMKKKNQRNKKK